MRVLKDTALALRPVRLLLLGTVLALCGCGAYRPGTDGTRRPLPQNEPANAQPQPSGSLPR